VKNLNYNQHTRQKPGNLALLLALGAAALFGTGTSARAALIGHWLSGAENLNDSSGFTAAGTHDGVAQNSGTLSYSSDLPNGFSTDKKSLNLPGNVGVMIKNSSPEDGATYLPTFDGDINSQFTISFWAKGMPGTWNPWVSKGGENGTGWQLRRNGNTNNACFTMRGIDNPDGNINSNINVNDNPSKWRLFTGVWDKATGTRKFYVDGIFSHTTNNNTSQSYAPTNNHLALGARQNGFNSWGNYFTGKLFDVRLYNTALTPSEVFALIPPAVPQGLVATPSSQTVYLSWTPTPFATSYTVSTTNTATSVEVTDVVTAPPFSKTGLTNGQAYSFKVLATYSAGASAYSAAISATPATGVVKDILTFTFPFSGTGTPTISGTSIISYVPLSTDVTNLAPTYTISPSATADTTYPSGTARNFTTSQTYTIHAEDGSTKTYTVQVFKVDPITYDFNGSEQGWTQIWPLPANGTMYGTDKLGIQDGDNLETIFGRSPAFYLNNLGDLTFKLAGGETPLAEPAAPSLIPALSINFGGFAGVALRDDATNTYVLSKGRSFGSGDYLTFSFTAAQLAPFANNNRKYTLDFIDYKKNTWGWVAMDDVSIPGTSSLPVVDPFLLWITTSYPTLSDKTPGGDPDGDGMTNQQEFAFGTDPSSGASANPILTPLNKTTGMFSYTRRVPTVSGLTYTVRTSTDLVEWLPDAAATANQSVTATNGDIQTVAVTLSGAPRTETKLFVRVQAP